VLGHILDTVQRRHGPSPWLEGARDDGGLFLPGSPERHAADLRIGPESVEVSAGGKTVGLAWSHAALDLRTRLGDGWRLVPWICARGGCAGAAIDISGSYVERTAEIQAALQTRRNRLLRFLLEAADIPLCASTVGSVRLDDDREAIGILCSILAVEPEMRARLAQPVRVNRLIHDLKTRRFRFAPFRVGFRRAVTEVLTGMRLAGFEHRFGGRPLPGVTLPPLDEVVRRVLERIAENPYARGVVIDQERAREIVRRNYLEVEPWPLEALIDQAPGSSQPAQPA
jgi:hypothetical protein